VSVFVSEKSEKGLSGTKNTGLSFSRLAAAGYKAALSQAAEPLRGGDFLGNAHYSMLNGQCSMNNIQYSYYLTS